MSNNDNAFTPIQPFDSTYGESYQIYNNCHYVQDKTLRGQDKIQLQSGNVYKYYHVQESAPKTIKNDESNS